MNRLQHFLRAKTLYNLHSPFVYHLYTEVLFSRAEGEPRDRYEAVLWRLERHYGVDSERRDGEAVLCCRDGCFVVVDHPHRRETRWQELVEEPRFRVSIDLFSVGIVVDNPRLSRQCFLLRDVVV